LVTLARLARPGGIRAVAAESLAVKHQLLIMKRSRRRGPNLTRWDRVILGFCTLLMSPRRLSKVAVVLKTSTLLSLHRALVKRNIVCSMRPSGAVGPDPRARPPAIGHTRDRLWSVDLFRAEAILLKSYWILVVMDIFTRRIIGFGVATPIQMASISA
jgi:putative transposase